MPVGEPAARAARVAQLRSWQYQGRMNHDHGVIGDGEYTEAMRLLAAELVALGEDPDATP